MCQLIIPDAEEEVVLCLALAAVIIEVVALEGLLLQILVLYELVVLFIGVLLKEIIQFVAEARVHDKEHVREREVDVRHDYRNEGVPEDIALAFLLADLRGHDDVHRLIILAYLAEITRLTVLDGLLLAREEEVHEPIRHHLPRLIGNASDELDSLELLIRWPRAIDEIERVNKNVAEESGKTRYGIIVIFLLLPFVLFHVFKTSHKAFVFREHGSFQRNGFLLLSPRIKAVEETFLVKQNQHARKKNAQEHDAQDDSDDLLSTSNPFLHSELRKDGSGKTLRDE